MGIRFQLNFTPADWRISFKKYGGVKKNNWGYLELEFRFWFTEFAFFKGL